MKSKPNPYGQAHREHRQKRIDRVGKEECEFTGQPIENDAQCHHVVPRLFNGVDHESNYRILKGDVHQNMIHKLCNVDNPEVVRSRILYSKKLLQNILNDEVREEYHEKIRQIDDYLMQGYIDNKMNKLPYQHRENIIRNTMVSNYETVRDLTIMNAHKDAIIAQMKAKLEKYEIMERQQFEGDGPILEA